MPKQQQQSEKMKRSYVVTMQSADEELTKEVIETFFKDFHRSFRVGKVVEVSTSKTAADGEDESANKNKRWEVELLSQAQNCPRTLSLRTRIDWKAADGRVGRVWLHHQALFATPPCQKCLSPEHATGKCPPEDVAQEDGEEGAGETHVDLKIPQKNIRRHVLRLTLGGGHSAAATKKNDHRKSQQQRGPPQNSHQHDTKANPKRINNGKQAAGKREPRGNKKTEVERVNMRSVEVVEVVSSSSTPRIEGEGANSSKTPQRKKRWQQRVHRKRGGSKSESNNAAAD